MQQISTAQTDRYAECNGQCSLLMGGSHINKNGDDKQENECSWVELVLFENKKKMFIGCYIADGKKKQHLPLFL